MSHILSLYSFQNQIQLLVDHIVYLSCLHLETTAQVISQDASNLRSVVMSIKVRYTSICVLYTHTYTHAHTFELTNRYNFAASKLLWHIEVTRTDIMF